MRKLVSYALPSQPTSNPSTPVLLMNVSLFQLILIIDQIFHIDCGRISVRLDYPKIFAHAKLIKHILFLAVHTGEIGTFIFTNIYSNFGISIKISGGWVWLWWNSWILLLEFYFKNPNRLSFRQKTFLCNFSIHHILSIYYIC